MTVLGVTESFGFLIRRVFAKAYRIKEPFSVCEKQRNLNINIMQKNEIKKRIDKRRIAVYNSVYHHTQRRQRDCGVQSKAVSERLAESFQNRRYQKNARFQKSFRLVHNLIHQ